MKRRELITLTGAGGVALISGCLDSIPSTTPTESKNPWGKDTLTVAVEQRVTARHGFIDLIEEALNYWEQNSETYAGFSISYRLRPNSDDPDIEIILVGNISQCGEHDGEEYAGCANFSTGEDPFARIRVVDGYDDKYLLGTLKHEIGHTLGLEHTDEPAPIMSNQIEDRIPNYQERKQILNLYSEAVTPWNEASETWTGAIDYWENREFDKASVEFSNIYDSLVEAASKIEEAITIAEDIEEPDVAELLRPYESKIELNKSAANNMQLASEEAAQRDWDSAEEYRTEANDDIREQSSIEIPTGEELADALGLPLRDE